MTIRRGSLPAVIGVGAVAVSIAVAVFLAAASGGDQGSASAPGAAVAAASAAAGPGTTGQPGGASVDSAGLAVTLPAAGSHVAAGTAPWASGASASTDPSSAAGTGTAAAGGPPLASTTEPGSPPRQLIVPDVIAAVPGGISAAEVARIAHLAQVRSVLPVAGARISVNGQPVNVLAAPASTLRPWTPPATAAAAGVWDDFAQGDLITSSQAAAGLHLRAGQGYPVTAARQGQLTFGGQALLGVPGVDAIVNEATAGNLGLVPGVAVLINAPAARVDVLVSQVKAIVGGGGQVVRLVPEAVTTQLPIATHVPTGKPANYLELYQESAAQYCPGLSWTVLAAIGEIESNNGQDVGPSSAGALGPMQFLPSTWAVWGTGGFGDAGAPDIMNPFDAVPSAARMLCSDGAGKGGQSLYNAIFAYNHADWYVNEVLTLAAEYAREY
ncbi:MAG TPA: lytic transglycosylase domain-containing protein [Trebonia sp.]|nr:lytic transglycosylase domain-containing protein [Trebonia sp.]